MKYLRYNYEEDRVGVWDGNVDDWYISGLHCGMCFWVRHGSWEPVRIEYGRDGWYLVGLSKDVDFRGLEVVFDSSKMPG